MEREIHKALWGREEWLYDDGRILVKKILAERRLSVQVHPNDATAPVTGGRPKTEMWCVMKGGPIFAGFRRGTTEADVRAALADGSVGDLLARIDAREGDCLFIPGGLVHAIGEGTCVYEVQQSSDTTFRLYDWGRLDAQGRPRTLHIEEAFAAMDVSLPPPAPAESVHCAYFDFSKAGAGAVLPSGRTRIVYFPASDTLESRPAGAPPMHLESAAFVVEC